MNKKETKGISKLWFALLAIGIVAFGSSAVSAEEWSREQQEVWNLVKSGWDLIVKGDAEAFDATSAEGFLEWWPNDPKAFGKEYVKAKYERWFGGNKPLSYKLKPVAISIIGDVANVFYFYNWNGDKMPATISGRMYSTWIKQDGNWKFMGSMGCLCDRRPYCN